ncbi:flagellar basal-body MS-ring/collar protein FliF [Effusibacillus lacus]|uniref:Flagellar M-ring protein n=1 Tax=Effusibacillus lacus TaxID=1348429 RepID=A0A292YQI4_9BACL|nr:flagellar basal-body MS-ring/collar protein FliF [Effusibacillus lacus]TCS76035.1 flagellar M-ring protein FliF [Effusibacillus lacus]GAX91446.1 flagellar M-ring protein FliF [Effusibacillus lacus]
MNQRIRELMERATGYWKQLEVHQRRNLVIAGVFFVLTVALLSWFAFRPNYVAVYSNLEPGTAGEIVAKLDEMKIPNRIQGTSVLVPEEHADKARVQLAMNNLPNSGHIDFGIFNEQSIVGMTENEFAVKYQNALQGSIANTIRSIKGIQDARVHIVMPERRLFIQQDMQDAKASVFLNLAPGASLSQEQVQGIQQLVAGSVKGLKTENITIVDQNGVRLAEDSKLPNGQLNGAVATKELEVRKMIQQDFEKRIRNALEKMFGFGNVEVLVNPEVSFDKVNSQAEIYTPVEGNGSNGIKRSEQTTTKSSENTPVQGGAPGTPNPANNPQAQPNLKAAGGQASNSEESSRTTNWEVNKEIVQRVGQAFEIKKMSVSVLVNGQINNQQKQDITNLVATAIGYKNDGSNNTDITVMGTVFQVPPNPFTRQWYENPWVIGGIAAGLLLLGGGVLMIARRRREDEDAQVVDVKPVPVTALEISQEETSQQRMKKQLEKMVKQKPEDFVNLLRTWLAEE